MIDVEIWRREGILWLGLSVLLMFFGDLLRSIESIYYFFYVWVCEIIMEVLFDSIIYLSCKLYSESLCIMCVEWSEGVVENYRFLKVWIVGDR